MIHTTKAICFVYHVSQPKQQQQHLIGDIHRSANYCISLFFYGISDGFSISFSMDTPILQICYLRVINLLWISHVYLFHRNQMLDPCDYEIKQRMCATSSPFFVVTSFDSLLDTVVQTIQHTVEHTNTHPIINFDHLRCTIDIDRTLVGLGCVVLCVYVLFALCNAFACCVVAAITVYAIWTILYGIMHWPNMRAN